MATHAQRQALDRLVALGGESVRSTLHAAAVDDDVAGDLLQGRLVREPEPAGFGTLLAHADPTAAKTPTAKRADAKRSKAKPRPDDSAAKARLQEAKKLLGAAQAEERQAQRRWAETQRELENAQAAVEKAQRELDSLEA